MPKVEYRLPDGTRVYGVTTQLKLIQEYEGLMFWSNKMGLGGKTLQEARQVDMQKAANIGTIAHELAEEYILRDGVWEPKAEEWERKAPDIFPKAEKAFGNFLRWAKRVRLKLVAAETQMVWPWDPPSPFGGTQDGATVLVDDFGEDELGMFDLKTSNGTYVEMVVQVAAYAKLWEGGELNCVKGNDGHWAPYAEKPPHFNKPIKRVELLRVGKDYGDFHYHSFDEEILDLAWDVFCGVGGIPGMRDRIRTLKQVIK